DRRLRADRGARLRHRQHAPVDTAPEPGLRQFAAERAPDRLRARAVDAASARPRLVGKRHLGARHGRAGRAHSHPRERALAVALSQGGAHRRARARERGPGDVRAPAHARAAALPEGPLMSAALRPVGIALALASALVACAPPAPRDDGAPLVWPPAPAAARIVFVNAFSRPEDLGVKKSLVRRAADLLFGASEARLVRPIAVVAAGGSVYVADPGAKGVH